MSLHPFLFGRPFVPVTLTSPNGAVSLFAIVDSGADACLFDTGFAQAFGLLKGDPGAVRQDMTGIGGSMPSWQWPAARFTLTFVSTTFALQPRFADLAMHGAPNLLGRLDFFAHFDVVAINQKLAVTEIR